MAMTLTKTRFDLKHDKRSSFLVFGLALLRACAPVWKHKKWIAHLDS